MPLSVCFCIVLPLVILLLPSRVVAQENDSGYELTFPAMGTLLAFQAFGDDSHRIQKAFTAARSEVDRLVDILSDYSAESETSLLSESGKAGRWQSVSPELWEVLMVCDRWHLQSDGAFDASIGQLSVLWRRARKAKTIPSQSEIDRALGLCGWRHVEFDREKRQVRLNLAGLKLDFGAIGKGYIIDRAYERLRESGVPKALVRAGGDLRCGDPPPGKKGWGVEIAKLNEREEAPQRIYLSNAAISSSGDLFQYIEIDGKRRSHVLDPRTGMGVIGPRMVTVIADRSIEADAADTALCAMRDADAFGLVHRLGNIDVRIVNSSGPNHAPNVRMTRGFENRLTSPAISPDKVQPP